MEERMAWEEIQEKYPDQWIGLADVEYEPDHNDTIQEYILWPVKICRMFHFN